MSMPIYVASSASSHDGSEIAQRCALDVVQRVTGNPFLSTRVRVGVLDVDLPGRTIIPLAIADGWLGADADQHAPAPPAATRTTLSQAIRFVADVLRRDDSALRNDDIDVRHPLVALLLSSDLAGDLKDSLDALEELCEVTEERTTMVALPLDTSMTRVADVLTGSWRGPRDPTELGDWVVSFIETQEREREPGASAPSLSVADLPIDVDWI